MASPICENCGYYCGCDVPDDVNDAKAEAVLQFVLWLIANDITGRPDTLDAEDFINTQGWSETGR